MEKETKEVVVTPEMLQAGIDVYSQPYFSEDFSEKRIVSEVYEAMWRASPEYISLISQRPQSSRG